MSSVLKEKLLRSRELGVPAGGHVFTVRRPTAADVLKFKGCGDVEIIQRCTVGWDLAEVDVIPGGGPEKVPFDKDLFEVWIVDQPEMWPELAGAILDAYLKHEEAKKAAAKN